MTRKAALLVVTCVISMILGADSFSFATSEEVQADEEVSSSGVPIAIHRNRLNPIEHSGKNERARGDYDPAEQKVLSEELGGEKSAILSDHIIVEGVAYYDIVDPFTFRIRDIGPTRTTTVDGSGSTVHAAQLDDMAFMEDIVGSNFGLPAEKERSAEDAAALTTTGSTVNDEMVSIEADGSGALGTTPHGTTSVENSTDLATLDSAVEDEVETTQDGGSVITEIATEQETTINDIVLTATGSKLLEKITTAEDGEPVVVGETTERKSYEEEDVSDLAATDFPVQENMATTQGGWPFIYENEITTDGKTSVEDSAVLTTADAIEDTGMKSFQDGESVIIGVATEGKTSEDDTILTTTDSVVNRVKTSGQDGGYVIEKKTTDAKTSLDGRMFLTTTDSILTTTGSNLLEKITTAEDGEPVVVGETMERNSYEEDVIALTATDFPVQEKMTTTQGGGPFIYENEITTDGKTSVDDSPVLTTADGIEDTGMKSFQDGESVIIGVATEGKTSEDDTILTTTDSIVNREITSIQDGGHVIKTTTTDAKIALSFLTTTDSISNDKITSTIATKKLTKKKKVPTATLR